MALAWIKEQKKDSASAAGNGIEKVRYFAARTDSPADDELALMFYLPELLPGQPWDKYPQMRVKTFVPRRRDGFDLWDLEVTYSLQLQPRAANPTERPAEVDVTSATYQGWTLLDADGNPHVNAAGDFLEAREFVREYPVFNVTKNLPGWFTPMFGYCQCVNDDGVQINGENFDRLTLLFTQPRIAKLTVENGYSYYPHSFQLLHNPETWEETFLNQGWNELRKKGEPSAAPPGGAVDPEELAEPEDDSKGTGTQPIYLGPSKERPSQPLFLNRKGRAYRDRQGFPTMNVHPSKIITIKRMFHRRLPFSQLPLY